MISSKRNPFIIPSALRLQICTNSIYFKKVLRKNVAISAHTQKEMFNPLFLCHQCK